MVQKPRVIYWFRTDLRLHDSPALKAALDLDPEVFWPVWTWDPHYVYRARVGVNRWQFLTDCQRDLSTSLTKLNPHQKLLLIRESPLTLFPKLFRAWKVTHLVFEKDTDAYGRGRDAAVIQAARDAGVQVISKTGRTLWDIEEIVKKNGGKPTMSITQLQKAGQKVGKIPRPIPPPTSLPDPGEISLDFAHDLPVSNPDINQPSRNNLDTSYSHIAGPKGDFSIPTLKELGFPEATTPHRGGETVALQALHKHLQNKTYIATFEKPKTAPTDFAPAATTLLSPHLHFGSLSVREFYWGVMDVVAAYKGKASQPPVNLEGQLLFREMYIAAYAAIGAPFTQIQGNPICRFIPWELSGPQTPPEAEESKITTSSVLAKPNTTTPQDPTESTSQALATEHLRRWTTGQTGYPLIDALMRQLIQTGWIHHLGRHMVACFLTRGGCYISWERGAAVFSEYLIDHEEACNSGNWMWLSASAFYSQYFKIYSPMSFLRGFGEEKAERFVREWVPELRGLVGKAVFEPWKVSKEGLRKAGVVLGGEGEGAYPRPMLEFAERRVFCLAAMKEAYKVGLLGDDARVKDGSWRALFADTSDGNENGKSLMGASGSKTAIESMVMRGNASEKKKKELTKADPDGDTEDMAVDTSKPKPKPKPTNKTLKGSEDLLLPVKTRKVVKAVKYAEEGDDDDESAEEEDSGEQYEEEKEDEDEEYNAGKSTRLSKPTKSAKTAAKPTTKSTKSPAKPPTKPPAKRKLKAVSEAQEQAQPTLDTHFKRAKK